MLKFFASQDRDRQCSRIGNELASERAEVRIMKTNPHFINWSGGFLCFKLSGFEVRASLDINAVREFVK
jgi:hypothetical protein